MPDHFWMPFAPLIAAQAAADATTTLRVNQAVLSQDFRHPTVLAKELATLDVLSDGRLEIGLGAGWSQREYEQSGIRFDPAPVRIERLEEVVIVLKGLFSGEPFSFSGRHFMITDLVGLPSSVQRPHPPIMIGGGGRKLLAVAARHADIIQLRPRAGGAGGANGDNNEVTAATYRRKLDWIREVAGDRFDEIELGAQLHAVVVTDDPAAALRDLAALSPTIDPDQLAASPVVAVGSLEDVCGKLLDTRDTYGINYFACPGPPVGMKPRLLAPVIERLNGR
jgi:probable F420-dependent oxidoreductase